MTCERVIHKETLTFQLARLRDMEMSPTGEFFVFLEQSNGSKSGKIVSEILPREEKESDFG